MKKNLNILFTLISIITMLLLFPFSNSFAVIENLSLNQATTNTSSATNNSSNTNNYSNSNSGGSNSSYSSNTSAGTVSNVSSIPDSSLGLANILNILLITIGVLLLLLGIAILIKLKK